MSVVKKTIDCLLIGNNQMSFSKYVDYMSSMGDTSGAFRDVNLSFYKKDEVIYSARDHFNNYHKKNNESLMTYDNIFSATIAYLGTFLNKNGLSFDYINSFQEEKEKLKELLVNNEVRTVAVTTTYYVASLPILDVIEFIRKYNTDAKIIIGGPYLATQYEIMTSDSFRYLLRQLNADFYVKSAQGEAALAEIVKAVKAGSGYEHINNIIYHNGLHYTFSHFTEENNKLEDNIVDWQLFEDDFVDNPRKMVMVRTVISCPFACSFCSFPSHAGAYRYLEEELFFRELDQIAKIDTINSVTFIDDTFNVPKKRFRNILNTFIEKDYDFEWNCNYRCQYATEEDVIKMKQAGCVGVFLGIESGSDAILKNMNKKSRAVQYKKGIELLKKHGILTYASFIVGFPGETEETIRETIELIETAKPDFFRIQLWYYDTMTPIHQKAEQYGLQNSQFEWKHNTMDSVEAANWIDYMHENVENSVWLPQNDFDYPSLFNLISRGWTMEQIKTMLSEFNLNVSHKLDVVDNAPVVQSQLASTVESVDFDF